MPPSPAPNPSAIRRPRPPGVIAGAGSAEGAQASSEAVHAAVDGLGGARPSLVLVFPDGDLDPADQLAQAERRAAGAPLAGMTASGAVGSEGPLERGCSALAFGPDIQAAVGVAPGASADPRAAGAHAAREALRELGERRGDNLLIALMLDASGDQSRAIAGAYEVAGAAVPLVGGGAGGSLASQLGGGGLRRDSVVAVALRSEHAIGVGHAHGCSPRATPSVVTRGRGRTLEQLDGRPAQDVYLEKLGRVGDSPTDADFSRMATVHPLAQPELRGDVRLRHVLGRAAGGGLACATHIPTNATIEFTEQTPDAIVRSTWDAVSDALAPLGGASARAALVFDCAGRRSALGGPGEQLDAEAAALRGSFGRPAPPLAGLYTRGEVGRVRGAKGDRNHAVVVAAFA